MTRIAGNGLGNLFKINLFLVNCNSVESAKAPVCNILSRSECKPKHECLFHSLDRSRTGSFISPFIQKCYSLILMVLCYNMITFHDYVFL